MSYYGMKSRLAIRLSEVYEKLDCLEAEMEKSKGNTAVWVIYLHRKKKLELEMKTIERKLNDN